MALALDESSGAPAALMGVAAYAAVTAAIVFGVTTWIVASHVGAGTTVTGGMSLMGWIAAAIGWGVSVFLVTGVVVPASRAASERRKVVDAHPSEPWLWRRDWGEKRVTPSGGEIVGALGAAGIGALIMSAVLAPIPIWAKRSDFPIVRPDQFYAFSAMAAAGAVYLFHLWQKRRAEWRRFHSAVLHLSAVPVLLGQVLHGRIDLPPDTPPNMIRLTLRCLKWRGRRLPPRELASEERFVQAEVRARPVGSHVAVEIPVPSSAPPTDAQCVFGGRGVYWELTAEAKINGPDLDLRFQVPIFDSRSVSG